MNYHMYLLFCGVLGHAHIREGRCEGYLHKCTFMRLIIKLNKNLYFFYLENKITKKVNY